MAKEIKKEGSKTEVGVGLALLAATAAGAFFLYGKNGAKNRKVVKGWMLKAKGEILERVEKLKDVNQEAYDKVVDAVSGKYEAVKGVDKAELAQMAKELKGHWNSIKKQINSTPKKKSTGKKKSN